MRERERTSQESSPWGAGGHSVMHHESPGQGSYENKLMLHLMHWGGDGFLRLGLDVTFQQTTEINANSQRGAGIRRAADTSVVCGE